MSATGHTEAAGKRLARSAYRWAVGFGERLSAPTSGRGSVPRLYYGGARPGDEGGARVKMRRLSAVFPEHRWTYNLVYVLSNAPYLPAAALRRLKSRRVPVVGNQNGVFYPGWYAGDWEAENRRMGEPHRLADYVFYQSEFCRRSAERFLGRREGAGEVLYNAVDTARFAPAERERGPAEPFVFLVAGKIPGYHTYRLEAAVGGLAAARKRGLKARLVVAGVIAPPARDRALELAATLGMASHVAFPGPYRQGDAPAVFNGADAFVITTHNDACPTAVVEAMACGLPVLYARSGGVPELVGSEAGVGLETGESWDEPLAPGAEAVAEGMLAVAENRATLAAAARARAVERFDIAPWLERHRQVFRSLLEGRHG